MAIAYFDCFSGISGDMVLGALLDAGLDERRWRAELEKLVLPGYRIAVQPWTRQGLRGHRVEVRLDQEEQPERRLAEIEGLIRRSGLSERVKETAVGVFRRLAAAEGRVHGTTPEQVHFHEVGAVDALVDIVGAVVGLELLGITRVHASPLPLGSGFINTRHGILPVPAPATVELLREVGAPTLPSAARAELVTPTGAALLCTLASFDYPPLAIAAVGYGFGSKELDWPNALRVLVGEPVARGEPVFADAGHDQVLAIETNLDDMTPEGLGYVMERLFAAGALDVYFTPIFMKKNRPATMLSVIAPAERQAVLVALVMRETTTLGVRVREVGRHKSQRELERIHTSLGEARVKVKRWEGTIVDAYPEYEDCAALARERNLPLRTVQERIRAEALAQLGTGE